MRPKRAVNPPHDPLCPLNGCGNHCVSPRTVGDKNGYIFGCGKNGKCHIWRNISEFLAKCRDFSMLLPTIPHSVHLGAESLAFQVAKVAHGAGQISVPEDFL